MIEHLIKYIKQKIQYYESQRGDEYFTGMVAAYEDLLDLCNQMEKFNASNTSES